MARKRAVKKRADMRKGGRVGKQYGGGLDAAIAAQIKNNIPTEETIATATAKATTPETLTDEQIAGFLAANPNASNAQIAEGMDKFNISPEQMSRVTGYSAADITKAYGDV